MKQVLIAVVFLLTFSVPAKADPLSRAKSVLRLYATDIYVQSVTLMNSFEQNETDASICFQVGQLDGSFSVLRMYAQERESVLGATLSQRAAQVGQSSRSELRALSNRLCVDGQTAVRPAIRTLLSTPFHETRELLHSF